MNSLFSRVLFVFLINTIVSRSQILQNDLDRSSSQFVDDYCTLGPEFWCANLTTARNCNTRDYCVENTWQKTSLLRAGDDQDTLPCQFCNLLVDSVAESMKRTSTHILQFSCKFLLVPPFTTVCRNFIKGIIDGINSIAGPIAICSDINFCPAAFKAVGDRLEHRTGDLDLNANRIKELIDIEKLVHERSKNIVKSRFLNASGDFSSQFINPLAQHIDDFYDHFIAEECLNVITGAGTDSNEQNIRAGLNMQSDKLPEKVCKQMISHLRNALTNDQNKNDILLLLRDVCKKAAIFQNSAACMDLIDGNFELVYEFLFDELDPIPLCAKVLLESEEKIN